MSASSSSSSLLALNQWSYDVFPSFSGQDVRRNFLSHLLIEFKRKGIKTFLDNQITRSKSLTPELIRAIRSSRISIIIFTKNYASSSWCLDELLEIMECRKTLSQKVLTIFYNMKPSHVRKQTGGFGKAFKRTCEGKTEEKKQSWKKALTDVANILGYHSNNWDSEAEMMLNIAIDITNKLNFTPSRDFDHLVGIEAHIAKMSSLLCMETNEAQVVGIWGPAGIGKTTIARVLYDRVSSNFQFSVFMENVKGSYNKGYDSYSSKLKLQEQFLSAILELKDMRIYHLGVAEERLNSMKVFIVLDDVDKLEQLEALANETLWFGAGSRIVVTSEHKNLFNVHNINHVYEVNFPSGDEALKIFSQSAFKQDSPPEGFMELAVEVTRFSNHLPLGLCVLGSSLRGKTKTEWAHEVPRLKANLHGDIEKILRVGYDSLGNDHNLKMIYLHIACLFYGEDEDHVIQLLEDSIPDIRHGLGVLVERALVYISSYKQITMHHLLQQLGKEIVRRQSAHEPGKRQFLIDSQEIYDVLTDETGTGSVLGISYNMSERRELVLSERAFRGMHNLQFLRFYKQWWDKGKMHLPEGLDCVPLPRKLKLLHWEACPMKCLSNRFRPECLIEIKMKKSKLKKLWEGIPMLISLKKMELSGSTSLKELPDLSGAINLKHLDLQNCHSLLKLPPSIWTLSMLDFLHLEACRNLEPLPVNYALDSLSYFNFSNCPKLKDFPEISSDIKYLTVSFTAIPKVPSLVDFWDCLHTLDMTGCENVTEFPLVPYNVSELYLNSTGIQQVPPWISDLYGLTTLMMLNCKKLRKISPRIFELGKLQVLNFSGCINVKKFPAEIFQSFSLRHDMHLYLYLDNINKNSLPTFTPQETNNFPLKLSLNGNDFESIPHYVVRQVRSLYLSNCVCLQWLPELPSSLSELHANNCVSLETLSPPFRSSHDPKLIIKLANCWKLDQQARKLVIEQWACGYAILPGNNVPNYFTHQARGSSLTIQLDPVNLLLHGSLRFKACVVVLLSHELDLVSFRSFQISCNVRGRHYTTVYKWPVIDAGYCLFDNHLFILNSYFTLEEENIPESEMLLNFKCLEMKEYPETVSCKILQCGVKLLEPCSCEYDSKAHPELSTLPLEDDEGNNNNIAETSRGKKLKRRSKKREWSSVAEGPERTSRNLRIRR